jgi:hypothetical protein
MAMQTELGPADFGYESEGDSPEQGFISRQICGMSEMVRENSGRATLIALGGGLVLGYLVGQSLANRPSRADRDVAERLGQRIIEGLDRVLPERVASRLRGRFAARNG